MSSGPERMEAYLKELEEKQKRREAGRQDTSTPLKLALSKMFDAVIRRHPRHPFEFSDKAYVFKERKSILRTPILNVELAKDSHYIPILLHGDEVGGIFQGKGTLRLDVKIREYLSEIDTFTVVITDGRIWERTLSRQGLKEIHRKEAPREMNLNIQKLKRRENLRQAVRVPDSAYYFWIEDAGRLGRFGLLLKEEEKLNILSDSLIRLNDVGFDVHATNDVTFETYSATNKTLRVFGSFSARNDIDIRCGLEAEEIVLRNDITVRGDAAATRRIAIRNDGQFLGEVRTGVFDGTNDIEVRGDIRAEIIKVRNDVRFLSNVYADEFDARNDIYIGGDAEVRLFKCSNDCTIRGDLVTSKYITKHDFRVQGRIHIYSSQCER